jgi:diguanylate cyclase (GGDEF)-like protein
MMAHGDTLGIIYLDTGISKKLSDTTPLNEARERAVRTIAEHLSLAVANLNLRETLRIQSIRDPLTGLFNRRYMEESLERELRRALRKEFFLSVLMVDIDHFKTFNDAWGHEAGDAVLRELAALFQKQLRAEDIACRYGGEEFLLVLPEADLEAARKSAERLLNGVRSMQISHYGRIMKDLTLSVGIACYPEYATTPEGLIHAADVALYRAKENGRNQCVIAEK